MIRYWKLEKLVSCQPGGLRLVFHNANEMYINRDGSANFILLNPDEIVFEVVELCDDN